MMLRYISTLIFAICLMSGAQAQQVITNDLGGRIGNFEYKYRNWAASGERVEIRGKCMSACTLVTAYVSPEHICIARGARLGFHKAWDMGANGRPVTNEEASNFLMQAYPQEIRSYINSRGGLRPGIMTMGYQTLRRLYQECPPRLPHTITAAYRPQQPWSQLSATQPEWMGPRYQPNWAQQN